MAEQTNLPSIPPPNENNLVAFARAVKEALEVRLGRRGQGLDAMVTFRDLDKVQMVQGDGRGGVVGLRPPAAIGTVGGGYDPTLDTTPPPAPTGVKASGAVRNIILEWDGPPSTYRNHAYAEIWRSSTNNLNDAAQIGQSGSTMYVDNVGEGQARYYWVRFVSQADVTGPWHAAGDAGEQAVTALDVGYTLGLLEGQIGETQLFETLGARIDLIDGADTLAGSVNARLLAEAQARGQDLLNEASARAAAISVESSARQSADASLATQITTLAAAVQAADATLAAAIQSEASSRADADAAEAIARETLAARVTMAESEITTNAATIQAEAAARADADGALATQITTVAANYQAADAATLTSAQGYADTAAAGALASAQAAIQTESTARADADGALAQSISTVQTTVAGNTSAIQTQATAINGLSAQYTVKVQAGGIVGGIGLAAEAPDGSAGTIDLAVRANRFYVAPPADQGDIKTALFTHYTTPTTINGVEIPAGTYLDAAFMRTFVAQKGQIGALAVDDAAIESVSAAKVTFGEMEGDRIRTNSLDANRIRTGTLFAGVEITAGERLKISAEGWIETYSAAGYSRSADYSRLDYGNIQLYRYVPALGQPVLYNYLSRLESGVGANNVEVTLPGYWRSQPKIMVSPAVLSLYRHDYANQSQAVRCEAINIQETGIGTMQYKFTPRAQLELAAATGAATININATSASNSWTSATYTTPANTSSVTLNVDLGSVRGTGTSGSYYLRQVQWRVMYLSGGSWLAGAWRTKAIGATLNQVADTLTFNFPSAAAWQFYIEYSASDAGGTFTTGAPQYDYTSFTATSSTAVSGEASRSVNQTTGSSGTTTQAVTLALPSYSPPSGYSVYEVTYNYQAGYYLYSYEAGCDSTASISGGPSGSVTAGGSYTTPKTAEAGQASLGPYDSPSLISSYQSYSKAATSYSTTAISITCSASVTKRSFGSSMAVSKCKIASGEAIIKSRRLITNSTTPSNSALFKSYSYSLSSALVLASGQLNWLAVGE